MAGALVNSFWRRLPTDMVLLLMAALYALLSQSPPKMVSSSTAIGVAHVTLLFGCFAQLAMVYRLGQGHLSRHWLWLLTGFIWLTGFGYGLSLGGLLALSAVFCVWKHIQQVYVGEARPRLLALSGMLIALAGWSEFYMGLALTLGLAFFSFLHCFLHEREEQGVSYTKVSSRVVWQRWFKSWGLNWGLPLLVSCAVCLGIVLLGDSGVTLPDRLLGVFIPSSPAGTAFGYFSTFHREFAAILLPLSIASPSPAAGLILSRVLMAVHLSLIGILPIVGILGMGYQVPNRFVYRLLQRPDEELLLFLLSGIALILATLGDSTAERIVGHGSLAFMLGFLVLARFLRRRPLMDRILRWGVSIYYGLLLFSYLLRPV